MFLLGKFLLLISFHLGLQIYQWLNVEKPSRKCSIMAYVIWINLMEIYYIHTKEVNYSAQNWKITWEKISVKLKNILRAIFSVQTLVLLLGRSCCTHIYCMTSEKHHKTSQVEKSHTQYKWPKQNDLIMGWIMYDAHHNRKLLR